MSIYIPPGKRNELLNQQKKPEDRTYTSTNYKVKPIIFKGQLSSDDIKKIMIENVTSDSTGNYLSKNPYIDFLLVKNIKSYIDSLSLSPSQLSVFKSWIDEYNDTSRLVYEQQKNSSIHKNPKLNQLLYHSDFREIKSNPRYPLINLAKGMVASSLSDTLMRAYTTLMYRRGILLDLYEQGNIFIDSENDTYISTTIQPLSDLSYVPKHYPFLKGLCYRKYNKFLNVNDFNKLLTAAKLNKQSPVNIDSYSDILWDLTYSIIYFKINKLNILPIKTNAVGCSINALLFLGLINRDEAIHMINQLFDKYGLYGNPLIETSHYLCNNGHTITIPIHGSLNERTTLMREFLSDLASSLQGRHYTFFKGIYRLNKEVDEYGHFMIIIKLNQLLYLIDITAGIVTLINNNVIRYLCTLYDGFQVIITTSSSEMESVFRQRTDILLHDYIELDHILDELDKKYLCIEQLKIDHKSELDNLDNSIDSTAYLDDIYSKLSTEEISSKAEQYLQYKSRLNQEFLDSFTPDIIEKQMIEQYKLSGGKKKKKISKKNKKISKKNKKFI